MSEKKKDDIEGVSPEELREYKDKLIAETYYNEEKGYKSKEKTYKMAREKNALITRKDVEDWFSRNGVALKPAPSRTAISRVTPCGSIRWICFR